jgi:hypothetical protein
VVDPEIGSQARQVISQYTAQEVYTSREVIQKQIRDNAQKSLASNHDNLEQPEAMEQPDPKHYNDFLQDAIQILDTLVLSIELPPDIVAAINRQTEQYYMIQEYKFRVEREAEESKRKQIEADGIAAFQKTVSQGISESYLRWRGIEATLELALSQNAKVVVIGSGKDGLPIILGNVDSPVPPVAPQPSANGTPSQPGAPPAPNNPTSPNSSQTSPNTSLPPSGGNGAGSPGTPPQHGSSNGSPPGSDKTSSAAPANPDKSASAASLDISDVGAILSRISGALRATGSGPSSAADVRPKQ